MRREIIPNILCFPIDKITGNKFDNNWIQTCFLENERKKTVVKEREKLGNVEGKSAGRQIFDLTHTNEMGECDTYISHEFELEATKLTMVNEIVSDYMKLDSVTNDFFDEFSQCV